MPNFFKWSKHINGIIKTVGWKYIDYLGDEKDIVLRDTDDTEEALEDEKNNDSERLCLIKSFLEYNKLLIQNNLDKLITKNISDDFLN